MKKSFQVYWKILTALTEIWRFKKLKRKYKNFLEDKPM
jgi:hypothetical protein